MSSRKPYTPLFHWKDNGIYDHDALIARFVADPAGSRWGS